MKSLVWRLFKRLTVDPLYLQLTELGATGRENLGQVGTPTILPEERLLLCLGTHRDTSLKGKAGGGGTTFCDTQRKMTVFSLDLLKFDFSLL